MSLLDALFTIGLGSAPPVVVPDARASLAVWCAPTCAEEAITSLEDRLDGTFTVRATLPKRPPNGARASLRVEPAGSFGYWTPDELNLAGTTLSPEQRQRLDSSAQVVILSIATPLHADPVRHLHDLNAAALDFARSQGAVIEDIDTREVYSLEAWEALRVKALEGELLLWEQFTIHWSEAGDEAVTLGLRKLGLHELALGGLSPQMADDALATLTLVAAWEMEGKALNRQTLVSVNSLKPSATRDWLYAWRVDPGEEGQGLAAEDFVNLSLRNRRARYGDPVGPIVEIGAGDKFGDFKTTASLMDQLWGWMSAGS